MRRAGFSMRRASAADALAAARIIADALAEHGLPFEPNGRDADVATFGARTDAHDLVAELEGCVVGLVSMRAHEAPGTAWVSKLFVVRTARGHGIGRALLRRAHDAARATGFHTVGLRSRRVFREALALYASEGYVLCDDPKVLGGDDVVLYRAL